MISTDHLRWAYQNGVFPMGEDDGEVNWYAPYQRALFPIEGIYVSSSLLRTLRRGDWEFRINTAFEEVMRSCRRKDGNWINEPIIRAFCEAHAEGWAHSGEVWREGRLVGGIYGIEMGTCFSAESMFHRERDMSKVALWAMVKACREAGYTMFDAQIMNPHLQSLGAFEIPQGEFVARLQEGLKQPRVRLLS